MPGVPPDAADRVKKLLKGMFRRNKNKKQDNPSESAATTQTTQTTASAASQQKPTPAQQSAVNDNAPNIDKPLPPTHPLETGPHDKPQEAVPQNHNAQPGPPTDGTQETKKVAGNAAVSPATTAQDTQSSAPVSAIEKETPPAPPPKNDEAVIAPTAPKAAPDTTASKENTVPATVQQPAVTEATPAAPIQQSNGTAETVEKAQQPNSSIAPEAATTAKPLEEKVAVQEEIKPVQKAQPSGGMSATSGPLEDYPDGMVFDGKE